MSQKRQAVECPIHNVKLSPQETRYGTRWACPTEGCTMVAWQKYGTFRDCPISAPADFETRQARIAAHAAFDKLWQTGKFKRARGYKLLSKYLGLSSRKTHISRFGAPQCRRVITFCKTFTEVENERTNIL